MSNLNDPHELEDEAAEITLPGGGDRGVDRPEPAGYVDPAARGSEEAAEAPGSCASPTSTPSPAPAKRPRTAPARP
jgi:hypothetical protein